MAAQSSGKFASLATKIEEAVTEEGLAKVTPITAASSEAEKPEATPPNEVDSFRSRGRMPEEVWQSTPVLSAIYSMAVGRGLSPEALLTSAGGRLLSCVSPQVLVESPLGSDLSLNHGMFLCGPSGAGKSAVMEAASKVVPDPPEVFGADGNPDWVTVHGLSSGEGLLGVFSSSKKSEDGEEGVGVKPVVMATRALIIQDEWVSLEKKMLQNGNTLDGNLSTMLQGTQGMGTQNADAYRQRRVEPHGYRMVLHVGGQPKRLGSLFASADQGLPQRFMFVNALPLKDEDSPLAGIEVGDADTMGEEELRAVLAAVERAKLKSPVKAMQSEDGRLLSTWAQDLKVNKLRLPQNARLDMALMHHQQRQNGVSDELEVHKLRQLPVLYHMLNLLHGKTSEDPDMWTRARALWDALSDCRRGVQRIFMEQEANRQRLDSDRFAQKALRAKKVSEAAVDPEVRALFSKLREAAERNEGVTRRELTQGQKGPLNGRVGKKLKELPRRWTKAEVVERAILEGYLVEDEGSGCVVPGHKE